MAQPEAKEQQRLFTELECYVDKIPSVAFIYATPNGRFRNIQTAVKLKREGQKRGVPDVCIPLTGKNNEPGAYLELKFGKNKCSPEQLKYIEFLRSQGYVVSVEYSWFDGLHFILKYLGVKPKWKHKQQLD